jgi:hypothetical protein
MLTGTPLLNAQTKWNFKWHRLGGKNKHQTREEQQARVVTRFRVNKEAIQRLKHSAREHSLIAEDN